MTQKEKDIQKLRVRMWFHRALYYVYDRPTLSDYDYDIMERSLIALEKKTDFKIEESPTQRVGYDPPVNLIEKIKSLLEYHFTKGVNKWLDTITYRSIYWIL